MFSKHQLLAAVSIGCLMGFCMMPLNASAQSAKETPTATMKAEMQQADKDMGVVLKKLQDLGAKPVSTLSVEQARKQPTPADAVKAVLKDGGKDATAIMAALKITRKDMAYPAGGATQPVRIYTPQGDAPEGGFPVIVYYHGGGFVIADLDTYEASAMALAHKTNAVVASVEYRHAPENRFPAAHEDAIAAYKWVTGNAGSLNANARRIAVAGESAGGNLAINVAIMARDQKLQAPVHMLLVYPVADNDTNTPSYVQNAEAAPLGKADMLWFFDKVLGKPDDKMNPMLDIIGKADLKGLPSATLITAQIDPLMSEGVTLAEKLKAAGSLVNYQHFSGVTHEFFGMNAVVAKAGQAQEIAAADLKKAFAAKMTEKAL